MRMSAADIAAYPKLAHYVKNDLPDILDLPAVVGAMKKVGQINRVALRHALTWGKGPELRIVKLANAHGEFTPGINSAELRLNINTVKDFETGKGMRVARAGHVYLIGVTIIHELVHWADG